METVNTKKSKVVTRSYSSDEEVIATGFPRSSFSQSYHNAFDGIIGRIIPAACFDVLPKSQFNGVNSGAITLERMVTPTMPDTSMHSYNFFCTYRAVDRDYVETAAPSKLNNFSNGLHFPMFSTSFVAARLFNYICNRYQVVVGEGTFVTLNWVKLLQRNYTTEAQAKTLWQSIFGNTFLPSDLDHNPPSLCLNWWKNIYLSPLAYDFDQYFMSFAIGTANPYTDGCERLAATLQRFLEYATGAGSLLDFYGYFIVDWHRFCTDTNKVTSLTTLISAFQPYIYSTQAVGDLAANECLKTNEYALRIHAAIWIEYFRQPMLQPLNQYLRYNRWDSTSILGVGASTDTAFMAKAPEAMLLLFMRPAPFGEDRISTAHIDDVCRNVYAPVLSTGQANSYNAISQSSQVTINGNRNTAQNDLHTGLDVVNVSYLDAHTGQNITVACPVPSMVGNFLNNVDSAQATKSALLLDLQTLKTSEKLSRELKRRMWFGDSYFDVVRADYDCDISDADVLRPHILGDGATTVVGASQQIASTNGTGNDSERGTRTAVAGGNMPNDPYTGFAQESGLVVNLVYMSMRVSYNPLRDFNAVRTYADMIRPLYAGTNESVMHKFAVNRTCDNAPAGYGFEPYGNYYRTGTDRAHGKFLREYKDYIALRAPKQVKLNGDFLTMVQLPLGHFADTIMLDGQYYVLGTHEFYATHSLPAPVEVI